MLSGGEDIHYLYVPLPRMPQGSEQSHLPLEEEFGNIKVRRCELMPRLALHIPLVDIRARINSARLVSSVRDRDFDIVHGHNPSTFARAGLHTARQRGKPFVYELHRLPFDWFGTERKRKRPKAFDSFFQWLYRVKERKFLQAADAIIIQTEMQRQRLLELFKLDADRIHIIPAGVDEEQFEPVVCEAEGKDLRHRMGWEGKIVFLYGGYLGRGCGVDMFLNAARELPGAIKQKVKVVLAGRGFLKTFVESVCKQEPELIEYLGLVEYSKMPAYYSAADVSVIPSAPSLVWESSIPAKLPEAMAMENIVLGSDVRGITELVENGRNGITYRKGDKADLIRKMVYIVENFEQMDELGKCARTTVIGTRSWKKCKQMLHEVYESVALRPAGCSG